MMIRQGRSIFLDGQIIPTKEPLVASLSPWVLSGRGVFETMRSYHGKIFLVDEHLKRLFCGLEDLRIKVPYGGDEIKRYLSVVLESNKLKDARLRLTVWRGKTNVRISIIAWPYKAQEKEKYQKGFTAIISHIRQDTITKRPNIKSIDYLFFLKAYRLAKVKGKDEAVLVNSQGFLVEGSRSNIFLVKDQGLYTPSLASGCLNGITRKTVLHIARGLKIKCREILVSPKDLFEAQEAFFTNSLIELMPLTAVNNKKIGRGTMGPITGRLLKAYRREVKAGATY